MSPDPSVRLDWRACPRGVADPAVLGNGNPGRTMRELLVRPATADGLSSPTSAGTLAGELAGPWAVFR